MSSQNLLFPREPASKSSTWVVIFQKGVWSLVLPHPLSAEEGTRSLTNSRRLLSPRPTCELRGEVGPLVISDIREGQNLCFCLEPESLPQSPPQNVQQLFEGSALQ